MAQDLFLREADGNHIILHQTEKYGDVQVVPLNENRELQRGGTVMADTELSGLVHGFLNRQGAEKCTLGTAYDKSKLADLTAELTDDLGIKLETIGVRVTGLMDALNSITGAVAPSTENACAARGAHERMDGILFTLTTLGIPYKVQWNPGEDRYIGFDIAGKTFYVSGAAGDGE